MIQVRKGVFETNSSSTHSLTICDNNEYERWRKGEIYYHKWNKNFIETAEIINKYDIKVKEYLKEHEDEELEYNEVFSEFLREDGYYSYDDFWDYTYDSPFETFEETHTTGSGEVVIAFGYYGYDG